MDGKTVFKFAVKAMSQSIIEAVKHNNMSLKDINYIIPHQANIRIIDSIAQYLKFDKNNVIVSLEKHANISAATIPVAMHTSVQKNIFKKGDLIALTAMGAGFSWGSALLKWGL